MLILTNEYTKCTFIRVLLTDLRTLKTIKTTKQDKYISLKIKVPGSTIKLCGIDVDIEAHRQRPIDISTGVALPDLRDPDVIAL